jgi:hypothetical protein
MRRVEAHASSSLVALLQPRKQRIQTLLPNLLLPITLHRNSTTIFSIFPILPGHALKLPCNSLPIQHAPCIIKPPNIPHMPIPQLLEPALCYITSPPTATVQRDVVILTHADVLQRVDLGERVDGRVFNVDGGRDVGDEGAGGEFEGRADVYEEFLGHFGGVRCATGSAIAGGAFWKLGSSSCDCAS